MGESEKKVKDAKAEYEVPDVKQESEYMDGIDEQETDVNGSEIFKTDAERRKNPPAQVTNAVYIPSFTKEGVTKEYGDIPPVKFTYKPMTDRQRIDFMTVIQSRSNVSGIRDVAYKMLTKHIIKTTLCVPSEDGEGSEPFDVKKLNNWELVDPNVLQEVIDIVIGDTYLTADVRKNLLTG